MIFNKLLVALALSAGFLDVALAQSQDNGGDQGDGGNGGGNQNDQNGQNGQNNQGGNTGTATSGNNAQAVLDPANIQTGSASDGQGQVDGVKAGQAPSETDTANFINFCTGKTLTNGAQVKGGSCNGIPMGDIPATTNMVSTVLTNPVGGCIAANQDFDVQLQVANLNAGVFTNPTVTYYTAPQALKNGNIIGHVHVTIQALGNSLTPNQPLDASQFAFFKGIDDAGDGNGGLKATVKGGLPAGNYRVCTMSAAANHQPVTMPVAQRGAQDDCVRFSTADNCADSNANNGGNANTGNANSDNANNGNNNGGNNNGGNNNGGNNNGGNNNGGNTNGGNADNGSNSGSGAAASSAAAAAGTSTTAAGASSSSTAANANNGGGQNQNNGGQQNNGFQQDNGFQQGGNQRFGGGGRRRRQRHRFQSRGYTM
ncbi:MAG: hypothetical protein Q9225_000886 [Loekoesia sp. 1 TL-2023]